MQRKLNVKESPPPWNLKGEGFILLYRFSQKEIQSDVFLSEKFKRSFLGGFGAVMIVDYKESNVGPYSELLFIPGTFRYEEKRKKTISKIYVSTRESIFNGRKNWAIPKEQASFEFIETGKNTEKICVFSEKGSILDVKIKSGKVKFPVNTALLPFPLVQEQNGKAFYTKFSGSGWGRFAKVLNLKVNPDFFPIITEKKPWLTLKVNPFKIYFPISRIEKIP
jgi:hypothetical protein